MKNLLISNLLCLLVLLFTSCQKDILTPNSSEELFKTFWTYMDERYVFMEERKINWDSIYTAYHTKFVGASSDEEVGVLFSEILTYIGDRHVTLKKGDVFAFPQVKNNLNLFYFSNTASFHNFTNIFDSENFTIAQISNSIAYLQIKGILDNNYNNNLVVKMMKKYNFSDGMVVDLRTNTGGSSRADEIVKLFFNNKIVGYYDKYKKGKAHNAFTDFKPIIFQGEGVVSNIIPIAVLICNNTYSEGNYITSVLNDLPNITLIGDKTGGGGGCVQSVYLPNGWVLYFTLMKSYNSKKELMEFGIEPDIWVVPDKKYWNEVYYFKGEDIQLEAALDCLKSK